MSGKSKSPAVSKSQKAGLLLGVSRVERTIRKARICKNVGGAASVCATALVEEAIEDIVQRAGEHAKLKNSKRIAVVHLISAVRSDPDTAMLLCNFAFGSNNNVPKAIDLILDKQAAKKRKEKSSRKRPDDATTATSSDLVGN